MSETVDKIAAEVLGLQTIREWSDGRATDEQWAELHGDIQDIVTWALTRSDPAVRDMVTDEAAMSDAARWVIENYGRDTPVDALAMTLFEAWCEAEPTSGPATYPASYLATFSDMARAALRTSPPEPASGISRDAGPGIECSFDDGEYCIAWPDGKALTAFASGKISVTDTTANTVRSHTIVELSLPTPPAKEPQ